MESRIFLQESSLPAEPQKRLRRITLRLLVLLQLSNAAHVTVFFQTEYQLVSPLIPRDIVGTIAAPFLKAAIAGCLLSTVPLMLFYKGAFRWASVVCGAVLVIQYFLPSLLG